MLRIICNHPITKDFTNADMKILLYICLHTKTSIKQNCALQHLSLLDICILEICERFVYKHTDAIECVKK